MDQPATGSSLPNSYTHDCTNEIDNNRTSFDILILKAIISKLVDRDARKTVQGYKSRCTQGR